MQEFIVEEMEIYLFELLGKDFPGNLVLKGAFLHTSRLRNEDNGRKGEIELYYLLLRDDFHCKSKSIADE